MNVHKLYGVFHVEAESEQLAHLFLKQYLLEAKELSKKFSTRVSRQIKGVKIKKPSKIEKLLKIEGAPV